MPDTHIHASAIRVMAADRHVVDPNERHQYAHAEDQPKGAVAGDSERQPNHISFAGPPVAVKDRSRPRRINVPGSLGFPNYHDLALICPDEASRTPDPSSRFPPAT